jgi:hypothetical protein
MVMSNSSSNNDHIILSTHRNGSGSDTMAHEQQ